MSNRKKIVRMYHVRFVSEFLVPALSRQEALELAEDSMVNLIEEDDVELGDIFMVTVENSKFHVVTEEEYDPSEVEVDDDDDEANDEDDDEENGDDDDDDDEDDSDDEGVDETEDDE